MNPLYDLVACTKALMTWMHAAHHVSKGTSFSGDHVNLFGEIYEEVTEDYDELVEKSIVFCDTELVACPVQITNNSLKFLNMFPTPANKNEDQIAVCAYEFIIHHIQHLDSVYRQLESSRQLSLGMDDFLASSSGKYEKFQYLLGQRIKKGY